MSEWKPVTATEPSSHHLKLFWAFEMQNLPGVSQPQEAFFHVISALVGQGENRKFYDKAARKALFWMDLPNPPTLPSYQPGVGGSSEYREENEK